MTGETLVLGLDVGGTTSRALLATAGGRRLGTGRAGGGNPIALDPWVAAAAVEAAVREALGTTDAAGLTAVTVGLAGGRRLSTDPEAAEAFRRMWERLGVRCPIDYAADALVAFAAGTPEPDGTLLLAGTGAVAAGVAGGAVVSQADGHGWLLGDRGSGFWLARAAAVAVLAELDGCGPATMLTGLVLEALAAEDDGQAMVPRQVGSRIESPAAPGDEQTDAHRLAAPFSRDRRPVPSDLVLAVAARTPAGLARLAPLVSTAAMAGDAVARRIVERAVGHLLATVSGVRQPGATTPVVLSGGILIHDTPVAAGVGRGIAELWPDAPLSTAVDGAAGAAWVAIRDGDGGAPPGAYPLLFEHSPDHGGIPGPVGTASG